MIIPRLHGIALVASALVALLAGFAFYFFLIGIFERAAAAISFAVFVTVAAIVWTRSDGEPSTKGP
jgi:hypothetical protein